MCVLGGGGGVEGKLGGGGYETNDLTFGGGGYETNYDIWGGGYETKNEWNTSMSMINKTTDFYNTIYFKKNRVYVPKCS